MIGKEALKEYKEIYIDKTFKGDCCPSQEWYLGIIEEDLERLEKLEIERFEDMLITEQNIKLKKVIEILKKYFGLVEYEEFEEYNIFTNDGYFVLEITKEEYDLLKEVFGND